VRLTSPAPAATFRRSLRLTADATDPDGISRVEFLLDGQLIATERHAPYDYSWRAPSTLAAGSHTVVARAVDRTGAVSTTAPVTVTLTR
jgi:hypothetical protein